MAIILKTLINITGRENIIKFPVDLEIRTWEILKNPTELEFYQKIASDDVIWLKMVFKFMGYPQFKRGYISYNAIKEGNFIIHVDISDEFDEEPNFQLNKYESVEKIMQDGWVIE